MIQQHEHAVVIGGSMAGLMAARVLSEHFNRVTVIERDVLPEAPEFRAGVPQGRHLHALLAQGQRIMTQLFPGLEQDFAELGAPLMRWGLDTATFSTAGWVPRFDSGIQSNVVTRVALEYHVRRRLMQQHNVHILAQTDVRELLTDAARRRVTGVRIQSRQNREVEDFSADFVVDVSGRNGHTLDWLAAIGYAAPQETLVNAHVGYATRWYKRPAGYDWVTLLVQARPAAGLLRGGGIIAVEGDRWVVTLTGANGDYPPTDEAEFMAFAKSLATPLLYDAICNAEPISPIYGFRYKGSRLRHFERTPLPECYVVLGDAACSFNPIYGQGMTAAALEAVQLQRTLNEFSRHDLAGVGRVFQQRLVKAIRGAWLMATGEDLRYPGTEGDRPGIVMRMTQRYTDLMANAMPYDTHVSLAFMQAMNLTVSPITLMRPAIMVRVLWHSLRHRSSAQPTSTATDTRRATHQFPSAG